MAILFCAVGRDGEVLVQHEDVIKGGGNFNEVATEAMRRLSPSHTFPRAATYSHAACLLHHVLDGAYVYFCITDKLCQRSRAFLFLNELLRRRVRTADGLRKLMTHYSDPAHPLDISNGELDELNHIPVRDSECILGDKVIYVKNKMDCDLQYPSILNVLLPCNQQVVVTVRQYWMYVIAFVAILLLYIVYLCGPTFCVCVLVCVLAARSVLRKVANYAPS